MSSYLDLHRVPLAAILTLVLTAFGCASSGPQVKVLGVTQPREPVAEQKVLVFVEVVNPGRYDLELTRLDYHFRADRWLQSEGQVKLSRAVAPGSSAIVEIPVPVEKVRGARSDDGVPFVLEGVLHAQDDRLRREWSVKAKGALSQDGSGTARLTLAAR